MIKLNDDSSIIGRIKIVKRDKITNEQTIVLDEENIVTDEGQKYLLKCFVDGTKSPVIDKLVLGNDVGNGDLIVPDPQEKTFTAQTQNEVYTFNQGDIDYDEYDQIERKITLTVKLDGQQMVIPPENELPFTSATTRFNDDTVFQYKRFSILSVTTDDLYELSWTYRFTF